MLNGYGLSKQKKEAKELVCFIALEGKESHFTSHQAWYDYELQTFYDNYYLLASHFEGECFRKHLEQCATHGSRTLSLHQSMGERLKLDPLFPTVFQQFVKMMTPTSSEKENMNLRP